MTPRDQYRAQLDQREMARIGIEPTQRSYHWRAWITFVASNPDVPARLSIDQYPALPLDARVDYDLDRLAHHKSINNVVTASHKAAGEALEAIVRSAWRDHSMVANFSALLSGMAGIGKSTITQRVGRKLERELRKAIGEPPPNPNAPVYLPNGAIHLPVVFTACASSIGGTATNLLSFFESSTGGSIAEKKRQISAHLEASRTRLLIYDQFQELDSRNTSDREQAEFLKYVLDAHPRIVTIGSGIDVEQMNVLRDGRGKSRRTAQTAARFKIIKVTGCTDLCETRTFLKDLERRLVLLRAEPGDLTRHAPALHEVSGGRIGVIKNLVSTAANNAILSGTERLSPDIDWTQVPETRV